VVVPLASVGVLPLIPPFAVGLAGVAQAFSLAENRTHRVFPDNKLGSNVEEVVDRFLLARVRARGLGPHWWCRR
jgi:hypothetical protein